MSSNENTKPGQDSDMELYLRLGVPDGLQVSSDQPTKIDYSAQDEHAHGQS
jgi:hypothetical protein